MEDLFFVSIIIPCRNEEKYIAKCLDSIVAGDYPEDKLEILVMDGMSDDQTLSIITTYASRYQFIHLFENRRRIAPAARNIGVKKSKGDIIIMMDAHSTYASDYVSKCVKYLCEYKVDHVGGIWKFVPRGKGLLAKTIVSVLSHPFGVGNAYYRTTRSGKPRFTDAGAYGCYKREVFEKFGLFNENLTRSYDFDFNLRLKKAGRKMLLVPEAIVYYYARSTFMDFTKHNFINGFWITYPLRWGKGVFSLRHVVPFAFMVVLFGSAVSALAWQIGLWIFIGTAGAYATANLAASAQLAIREKDLRYLLVTPVIFATLHFSYGLGSLWGLPKVLVHTMGRLWDKRHAR